MSRSLLYRLFGLGRIPRARITYLENEGIVLMEQGLRCRIHYKDFRAPGKRFIDKRVSFPGSLVITQRRVAAFTPNRPLINIPLDSPGLDSLKVSLPQPDQLEIQFYAEDFNPLNRGLVSCRFNTPAAGLFNDALSSAAKKRKGKRDDPQ